MPETKTLLGSTGKKITKDKNDENVPHLETTKVILGNWYIANNLYQKKCKNLVCICSKQII